MGQKWEGDPSSGKKCQIGSGACAGKKKETVPFDCVILTEIFIYSSYYRCVVLSDPLKDTSRSQESWNAFLTKLRTLLLMSFTKNLGKFEDDMRTLREKRTEPGWSFCDYFMVQVK